MSDEGSFLRCLPLDFAGAAFVVFAFLAGGGAGSSSSSSSLTTTASFLAFGLACRALQRAHLQFEASNLGRRRLFALSTIFVSCRGRDSLKGAYWVPCQSGQTSSSVEWAK
jgi:hypothetical protein